MVFQTCCAAAICLCSLFSGQLTSFRILDSCDELLETATTEARQYQCRRLPWSLPWHCPSLLPAAAHPTQQEAALASTGCCCQFKNFGLTALSWEQLKWRRSFTGVFSSWKESLTRGREGQRMSEFYHFGHLSLALLRSWADTGHAAKAELTVMMTACRR